MRTTYKNNVAKIKKSVNTGAATDDIYEPTWPHFDSMKFLDECTANRTSLCSYTTQELNADNVETVDLTEQSDAFKTTLSETIHSPKPVTVQSSKPVFKPSQSSNKPNMSSSSTQSKNKQAEVVDECLEVLRSVKDMGNSTSIDKSKDRCDCYGQYVTASLKEMTQWSQTLAMAEITNVLIKYDPNNPE